MITQIMILFIINMGFEFLFEKLNQTQLEPFEKIQAQTRFMKNKHSIKLLTLGIVFVLTIMIGGGLVIHPYITAGILGLELALINTVFESTFYDALRNNLR